MNLALDRILYPVSMTDEAKEKYLIYIKEHIQQAIRLLGEQKAYDSMQRILRKLAPDRPLYLRLIDKNATGVEMETVNNGLKVYTVGKDVYVLNVTGTMNLYDLTGRIVKTLESDGNTQFTVEEAGCYILRTDKETVKLLIK